MGGSYALLATVTFRPEGLLGWIIVGLVAGWLAGKVMGEGGFGLLKDLVVGLVGAIIGGVIVGLLLDRLRRLDRQYCSSGDRRLYPDRAAARGERRTRSLASVTTVPPVPGKSINSGARFQ